MRPVLYHLGNTNPAAWCVSFYDGGVSDNEKTASTTLYVRGVRGGS